MADNIGVDEVLPLELRARPLRYLFIDFNSYFASVEQQENPELRGRPVAVIPVDADSSSVIAASYEAKAFGVKCGTNIGEAKRMCPGIVMIQGKHPVYTAYHNRILDVVNTVLPVEKVCSVDEMRIRLLGEECERENAIALAKKIKTTVLEQVGECIRCSVGIAPNPFLAKMGTELQKPDGLVVIEASDLPHRLHELKLTDFTGINRGMSARLKAHGIFTAEQLCKATKFELRNAFGSITGERWWYLLRGFEMGQADTPRKTLSQSHILPPEFRTDQGCREVLLRLIQKASARLRQEELWTTSMVISIRGKRSWHSIAKMPPTQDTITINQFFVEEWEKRDYFSPIGVAVTFYDLKKAGDVTPSLFHNTEEFARVDHAVDKMNRRFGKNKVHLAALNRAKDTAGERIAFQKTALFSEGAGDNEYYINTFTGEKVQA